MKVRRKRGQSIVELAVGLMALIPIVLVVFDLAVIVIGVQINDSTCREAARVAASGNPNDALDRAKAVVARANQKASGMLSNFQLVPQPNGVKTNVTSNLPQLLQYGGPVQGTVQVETEVDIKPFVVQFAYNGQSPLKFRSRQSFPFTYVFPNTSTPTAGGS
jgi:Flp pilus assembly protein TadG